MKSIYIYGGAAFLIATVSLVIFFLQPQGEQPLERGSGGGSSLVGDELLVSVFTVSGDPTGTVLLQVPFLRSLGAIGGITIAVDTSGDGIFDSSEILVGGVPVTGRANWNTGYYATSYIPVVDGMQARVIINDQEFLPTVRVEEVPAGDLFDLESVTDPENATKGFGVNVAHAEGETIEVRTEGVPDLDQRIGECAPTAAANNLISLVDRYGGEDLIPGDPQDFIENLKRHMNWTPENGVPPDDFVAGKNRWAAAAGVPITTTKVGDTHGRGTIDAIRDALQNGGAVELRIKLANAAATKVEGGHMVSVVGIHQGEGQTYLEINDPYTKNSGTEMVEIRGNQITNYGPWQGITLLSWGFVQMWEGHPTGELLDTMTDAEIAGIRQFVGETPMLTVIEYNGKYLPVSQLIVEDETGCGDKHWHAARGVVTATDGTQVPDPGPQCGYGKLKDRPSQNIEAPNNND